MDYTYSFGYWVMRRRKSLDLTRKELAQHVSCSISMIKKIERDERRPSPQMAESLANALHLPTGDRQLFLQVARGNRPADILNLVPHPLHLLPLPSHNLPTPPTPFIGREKELAEILQLLANPHCRLLTLVGPGGIGKTRLALRAAEDLLVDFPQGVYLVALTGLQSEADLYSAINDALNLKLRHGSGPQLLTHLQRTQPQMLLVLDNFEHLIAEAGVVTAMLRHTSRLKILTTSQERLNSQSEWIFRVEGLSFPLAGDNQSNAHYSSLDLFLQTTRRLNPKFAPTNADLASCLRICRLVEGMPLAIELAAFWTRALSCHQIADQIEEGLDILVTQTPDMPERHRSIRAVFDHSWSLISKDEQRILSRLSVFHVGFTFSAAQQVADATLPALAALIDKSLLRQTMNTRPTQRYTLHELVRQYARQRLIESGDFDATNDLHLRYFVEFAEEAEPKLFGPEQVNWLEYLNRDFQNFLTALDYAQSSGEIELGLRLAGALRYFWTVRGYIAEGGKRINQLLASSDGGISEPVAAKARLAAAALANALGDQARAETWFHEGLNLYSRLQDKNGMARAHNGLGNLAWMKGELDLAQTHYTTSLSLYSEIHEEGGMAGILNNLGLVALEKGNHNLAFSHLNRSLMFHRKEGDIGGMAIALNNLGNLSDDPVQSTVYYQESLGIYHTLGDMENAAETLEGLAGAANKHGLLSPAVRLLGAVNAIRRLLGVVQSIQDQQDHQELMAAIQEQLTEAEFQAAWREGQVMTLEQAITYGLQVSGFITGQQPAERNKSG